MSLANCSHWIFDMDGTLTKAAHDFDAIRVELGIPEGKPVLETIGRFPPEQARRAHSRLAEIELEIATKAVAQPGARKLLRQLRERQAALGLLTRNTAAAAKETLSVTGLAEFFKDESIVARETCAPKPNPAGVLYLVEGWEVKADCAVVVGDYLYDLQAGRDAGARTVHFDVMGEFSWPEVTDFAVTDLDQLFALATNKKT